MRQASPGGSFDLVLLWGQSSSTPPGSLSFLILLDRNHHFSYTLCTQISFMPNKQNAKKALRQAEKRTMANVVVKNAYKRAVKTARTSIASGKKDVIEELRLAQKQLGKAVKKGVLKKNTAARKLSRLAKQLQKITA